MQGTGLGVFVVKSLAEAQGAARRLKSDPSVSDIPIVAVTA